MKKIALFIAAVGLFSTVSAQTPSSEKKNAVAKKIDSKLIVPRQATTVTSKKTDSNQTKPATAPKPAVIEEKKVATKK